MSILVNLDKETYDAITPEFCATIGMRTGKTVLYKVIKAIQEGTIIANDTGEMIGEGFCTKEN